MTFALIYVMEGLSMRRELNFFVGAVLGTLVPWWIVSFLWHCIAFDPLCSVVKLSPFSR